MEENECLVENKSEKLLLQNIKFLRNNNNFLDVTLMCEDGVVISAHKLILASHSEKFKQIFSQMSSSSSPFMTPCIYLTGVSGTLVEAVIDYLYTGEARVNQSRLPEFLKVGQTLQVNSLMEQNTTVSASSVNSSKTPTPNIDVSKLSSPCKSSAPVQNSITQNNWENNDIVKEEEDLEFGEDNYDLDAAGENRSEETMLDDVDLYEGDENDDLDKVSESIQDENISRSLSSQNIFTPTTFSPTKDSDLTEDESKILVENLKILGLHHLSKDQLKDSKSKSIIKMVMSKPTQKLPCPVELLDEKQMKPWIIKEILKNIIEQGKRPVKFVKWGTEGCRPDFWPDELWPWHMMSNIGTSQKKHKPEDIKLVEVLRVAVTNRLRSKNLDPKTYLDCDETILKNKMRFRGMTKKQS